MIELTHAAAATVRDPLVVTLFVLCFGGLLSHFLFRGHPRRRAVVRVIFLVVLTFVLLRAGIVP
jgi:hypothetical protein